MTQTAQAEGPGAAVVQILGDGNAVSIAGAIGLRLTSYGRPEYASAPRVEAKAGEPGFTPSGRSVLRVLSPHNRESLPFQGREVSIPDQKVPTRRRDLGQFPGFGRCLGACAPQ